MQLNGNEASVRHNAVSARAGSDRAREIDLYEELLTFVEMTPDQQSRYLHPENTPSKEPAEPVNTETAEPGLGDAIAPQKAESMPEPSVVHADLNQAEETIEAGKEIADPFTSGPLAEMCFDSDCASNLSGRACPVCEAESGIDDLFCMSCGSFLNGIASTSPSNPVCADCSQGIAIDEVFCPWCGSVLAVS